MSADHVPQNLGQNAAGGWQLGPAHPDADYSGPYGCTDHQSLDYRFAIGAGMIGISVDEYRRHVEAGEKRCCACKAWHPIADMQTRASKPDGLDNVCKAVGRARALANIRRRRKAKR